MLTLIELAKRRRVEIRPFASLTPLIVSPNPPSKRRRKGGTPIRSKADALAALDVIWEDLEFDLAEPLNEDDFYPLAKSLLKAIRRYIEEVRS